MEGVQQSKKQKEVGSGLTTLRALVIFYKYSENSIINAFKFCEEYYNSIS